MINQQHRTLWFALSLAVIAGCYKQPFDLESANKEVVRSWFAALDAQDYDALTILMDDQFVVPPNIVDDPPRKVGREATFEMIRGFYSSFPNYTHEIRDMIAEGNQVSVRAVLRGTHAGDYGGVAPTGVEVEYYGAYMMTVIDGVLTEGWNLDDEINLYSQLGMELTPVLEEN